MFCCYVNIAMLEGASGFGCPGFEGRAMWVIFDARDHKIGKVAVFVGYHVRKSVFEMISDCGKASVAGSKRSLPSSSMTFSASSIEA